MKYLSVEKENDIWLEMYNYFEDCKSDEDVGEKLNELWRILEDVADSYKHDELEEK
jgi:hypothetical protein